MSKRIVPRWLWIPIVLVALVVGGFVGSRWLERQVLKRSESILADLSGPGSTIRIGQVDLDLWAGDLRWSDVFIEQPLAPRDTTTPMRIGGRVEEIALRGLSPWQLIFGRTLSVSTIAIVHPDLELILARDTITSTDADEIPNASFKADTITLERAVFRMRWTGTDSTSIAADSMDLRLTGIESRWRQGQPLELSLATANGHWRGMRMRLPPLYDLHITSVELSEDGKAVHVHNATAAPRKDAQHYDQVVHFEQDLFDAHMDSASIAGLDLNELIGAGTLSATELRIAGVFLIVSRDRTMPDPPFKYKPLLSRLLRDLPIALCMDSVVVEGWNVTYQEKGARSSEFGDLAFNDLNGTITGLCTKEGQWDTVLVDATARLYDRTGMSMQLRTVVADSSDRFTVRAHIDGLPIRGFNRLTEDLMRVRATEGTIASIDMTMTGNDDQATGRVDMEYEDLQFALLKQDGSNEKRRFMTSVANQIVRSKNLSSDPNFKYGDFTIDRRKDRFLFNYLWSGLREGITVSVVPGVVQTVRQMDKDAKKKKKSGQ